ncbi:MAG: hypothetical protein VKI42_04965 [Synechococcaceae cyanobacterium]|nr:hypothetical protein [Synechococcaceae cyanobacterium]
MPDSTCFPPPSPSSCLGRTCLKWSSNGELTSLDFHLVMERLAQVDQELVVLYHDPADSPPEA